MKVKKISIANVEVDALPELLDKEKIGFQPIDNVNWEAYPYRPKVEFRIAHSDDAVLLHFNVKEASVRAKYGEDDGSVWTDSCVEFFSVPAGDGIYYNIECNCIGTILIGAGAERNNRERASREDRKSVELGNCNANYIFVSLAKLTDSFYFLNKILKRNELGNCKRSSRLFVWAFDV